MKKNYTLSWILICFSCLGTFAQCPAPATVPYVQGFQFITLNNQLPPCWAASNMSATCLTYTTVGSECAAFYYLPAGDSYFYSEGFQLMAGITYSISSMYRVAPSPNVTWTNFSMHLATSQSSTGLVQLATTAGNITNTVYSPLSNTFVVPANGVYYIAIKGASNGGTGSQLLYWDQLYISIPCSLAANQPSITGVANPTTVCEGKQFTITVTGADTYTWNTGVNTPSMVSTAPALGGPGVILSITHVVKGTNALTGCVKTASMSFGVKPTPTVNLISVQDQVCSGAPLTLKATGSSGSSYSWSTGQQGSTISVSPTVDTDYTVTVTNSSGCSSYDTKQILVLALPVISASASATGTICAGDEFTLTAYGANSYTWQAGAGMVISNPAVVSTNATTTYTVLGADQNQCVGKATYLQSVMECTGLKRINEAGVIAKIYPNPGYGNYVLETGRKNSVSVNVKDLTGRTIFSGLSTQEKMHLDLRDQPAGVYFLELSSEGTFETMKLIRN